MSGSVPTYQRQDTYYTRYRIIQDIKIEAAAAAEAAVRRPASKAKQSRAARESDYDAGTNRQQPDRPAVTRAARALFTTAVDKQIASYTRLDTIIREQTRQYSYILVSYTWHSSTEHTTHETHPASQVQGTNTTHNTEEKNNFRNKKTKKNTFKKKEAQTKADSTHMTPILVAISCQLVGGL